MIPYDAMRCDGISIKSVFPSQVIYQLLLIELGDLPGVLLKPIVSSSEGISTDFNRAWRPPGLLLKVTVSDSEGTPRTPGEEIQT